MLKKHRGSLTVPKCKKELKDEWGGGGRCQKNKGTREKVPAGWKLDSPNKKEWLYQNHSRNPKPTTMQKILSLHLSSMKLTFTPNLNLEKGLGQ